MKVYLWPTTNEIEHNNGIGRIVYAQYRYLPAHGITFVNQPEQADLTVCHTQKANVSDPDVVHLHGMYWTGEPRSGDYRTWHWRANQSIIDACRRARRLTVPSAWCQLAFQRDMRITPEVIPHGIDLGEWEPGEPKGYALWNKNRDADVCDPLPVWELANRGARVVTTFAPRDKPRLDNLTVVGPLPHDRMKKLIQSADVYLATVKETYGIGTVEAMACGVPVVGFRHGGTAELVEHEVSGYLAKPGDYEELFHGLAYCLANRDRLGKAARQVALQLGWEAIIGQYARLYQQVWEEKQAENHGVSIVIPNYNYAEYLPEAVQSALDQTLSCEVIVVDDGSTDNTEAVLRGLDGRVKVIRQKNKGVAAARNAGIAAAKGEYIICLDADDRLDERYAASLKKAMDKDRSLGVVYTGLGIIGPDNQIQPNRGWPLPFSWEVQSRLGNPPPNCIPVAAMFRKEMWRRSGGYLQAYAPGEDAEFFTRGLATGFTALRLTEDAMFHYRVHPESASREKKYVPIDLYLPWIRDKQYPLAAPLDKGVPPIRSYSDPKVSIIIALPEKDRSLLPRVLNSVLGQTVREWEVIVVQEKDGPIPEAYPFVRTITRMSPESPWEVGLEIASAPLTYFLPASALLMPTALAHLCRAYSEAEGRYIYSDFKSKAGSIPTFGYAPERMLEQCLHPPTVLISTEQARRFRWESEWEFFIHCAIAGVHGRRLSRAVVALDWKPPESKQTKRVYTKYAAYRKGDESMAGCCGGNGDEIMAAKAAIMGRVYVPPEVELEVGQQAAPVVRLEFVGNSRGTASYGGPGVTPSGKRYRAGANNTNRFVDADPRDVHWLVNSSLFRVVTLPPPPDPELGGGPTEETTLEILARMEEPEDEPEVEAQPAPRRAGRRRRSSSNVPAESRD